MEAFPIGRKTISEDDQQFVSNEFANLKKRVVSQMRKDLTEPDYRIKKKTVTISANPVADISQKIKSCVKNSKGIAGLFSRPFPVANLEPYRYKYIPSTLPEDFALRDSAEGLYRSLLRFYEHPAKVE